jgi:hypothetical protein
MELPNRKSMIRAIYSGTMRGDSGIRSCSLFVHNIRCDAGHCWSRRSAEAELNDVGRFLASKSPEKVALWFTTRNATPNLRPSYDLAPSQDVLAIRFNPEVEQRILEALRWGLVRFRAKDIKIGHCLITRSSAPAPS